MNEELAAYITRLCELSGHTTRIKNDLVKVEPGEDLVYDAFTMVKEYYAYGHVERYSFSGEDFGSASFEIFKKFAIMHFAADIRAAHQLPPLTKNLRNLLGEELLQVSLHAVLHEAGVHSQILRDVGNDVVDADD